MIKTKSRLFNISSAVGCLNGDFKSQVNISLPNLTFHLDNIQNAYLSVVHCEVPNSFYIVNYTNNQFVLNIYTQYFFGHPQMSLTNIYNFHY